MLKENKVVELTDLTVATVSGEDAQDFLQGQLSQDIKLVDDKNAVLAAYCSPKGRVIASMLVLRNNDSYLLLTKADNAMAFIQRLRMFVLRAKVEIQIVNTKVYGAYDMPTSVNTNLLENKTFAVTTSQHNDNEIICISAPSNETSTRHWVLSEQSLNSKKEATLNQWQAQDITAGLPWVIADNQDVYIPQTLNFDLINGVSFTKGCYPGQEVVARSHYRGTIKRRCAYAIVDLNNKDFNINGSLVGKDIFDANKPKSPCGRVINAVIYAEKIFMLIEVQLSDLGNADFRLHDAQGLNIDVLDMLYSITE